MAIHVISGTNGSGKTTIVAEFMRRCGMVPMAAPLIDSPRQKSPRLHLVGGRVMVIGRFSGGTSTVDSLDIAAVVATAQRCGVDYEVVLEGQKLFNSYKRFIAIGNEVNFVHLVVPIEDCVSGVLARRKRVGNTALYDPKVVATLHGELVRKALLLETVGLKVLRLDRDGLARHLDGLATNCLPFTSAQNMCIMEGQGEDLHGWTCS